MNNEWAFQKLSAARNLNIVATEGVYLHCDDGRKILDAAGGAVAVNVGHGRREVIQAMSQALARTSYALPFFHTPERDALAEELASHWLPPQLSRMNFCSSGSDAIELAVKMAVQYQRATGKPDKKLIITRNPSYHGNTLGAAGWSGHRARQRGLEHVLPAHPVVQTPYRLRGPAGLSETELTAHYIRDLESTIAQWGSNNIAAMLAEPVTGVSGGGLVPPEGYWAAVQAVLKKHNILLILDEIVTGFGRLGQPMAVTHYGIEPDLLVSGKGLASGYAAINCVFGTDDLADALSGAGYAPMYFTHSAAPMNCAGATAVLRLLREEGLVKQAAQRGSQLQAKLADKLGSHRHVAEVRGEGLLVAIELVADRTSLRHFEESLRITEQVVDAGLERNVLFYPGGTGEHRDILCIGAPFIIDESHISQMVDALEDAINSVLNNI